MSIPAHTLEQLNSQANLVEIIGKHTKLKKAGREYKGCCPFHGEKTPSFYVNPQKNVYNCFGCNVGGNAFTFLQEYENRTFMEAAMELSRQTGIEIPKDDNENVRYRRNISSDSNSNTSRNTNRTRPSSVPSTSMFGIAPPTSASDQLSSPTDSTRRLKPATDANIQPGNQGVGNQELANQAPFEQHTDASTDPNATSQHKFYDNVPPDSFYDNSFYDNNFQDSYYNDTYGQAWHSKDNSVQNSSVQDNSVQNSDAQNSNTHFQATGQQNNASEGNLYDLLDSVTQFYQHNLQRYPNAHAYFKQRDLTDKTIATFNLGYAPSDWQHLQNAFPQDVEGLKALGLIRTSESGRDYDLLRDRVIFPIKDARGRVIGFAGRALDNEVKPKYINSSDSPVFHKQNVLYGYYESRQHRANDWLVVEGYMDVIALYQAGIYGAVASMGTAVNEMQIARLLQYNPTLTLSFDGDSAGQKAAWRTLEISLPVLEDGKSLRFLTLPNGHDPDTFIKDNGAAAMQQQIKQAIPLSQYVFAYLSDRNDLSLPENRAKLMSQVRSLTAQLPKGSSFRYILNSDIYQRLNGRRNQKAAAHDALLDFDSDITISLQLELCLLFDPHLLGDDPIDKIWARSGIKDLALPQDTSQLPPLPSWDAFQDNRLKDLVDTIKCLLPAIPKDINLSAHFILANLSHSRREQLSKRWLSFYDNLTQRGIIDVSDLVDDLLVKLLEQALTQQIKECNGIKVCAHISKQKQQLLSWYKDYQSQNQDKDSNAKNEPIAVDLHKYNE